MSTFTPNNLSKIVTDENNLDTNAIEIKESYSQKKSEGIGLALTSIFKLEKLYKQIVNITASVLEAKYASLMILEGNILHIMSSKHLPETIMKERRVRVGEGISGWVALKGQTLLIKDIESDARFRKINHKRYSSKSFISMPLIHKGKVIGVINANDKKNNEIFNGSDVELLKVVAKYSTIAIRNAVMIKKSKKRNIIEELEEFYKDSTKKYIPVTLQSLKSGPFSTSELYLENGSNGKINYVLYWKGGKRLFVNEQKEEFLRNNINRLFVPKNGKKQFLRYVETNLERIVEDNDVNQKDKFKVINDVAFNIVDDGKDINSLPDRVCNIERSKIWISNVLYLVRNSKDSLAGMIKVMKHDGHSYKHSVNVAMLGLVFAHYLGMSNEELNKFGLGLFFQDIGMRKIDPLLINKPSKLTEEEFKVVRKHPEMGVQVLQDTGEVAVETYLLSLLHHENFNGSGYPYGLRGDDIDYSGRIARIVDVYDALTSSRPYASKYDPDNACALMKNNMKGTFDTGILDSFVDFLKSAQVAQGANLYVKAV